MICAKALSANQSNNDVIKMVIEISKSIIHLISVMAF